VRNSVFKHALKGFSDALRTELMHRDAPVSVTLSNTAGIDTLKARHAKNDLRMQAQNPPLCGDGGAGDPAQQLRGTGRETSRRSAAAPAALRSPVHRTGFRARSNSCSACSENSKNGRSTS
jgi:hypothetical protein